MGELTMPDMREKIPYGQTLLLAEPIFDVADQWQGGYQVPLGAQDWVRKVAEDERPIKSVLMDEYASIALGLRSLGVDFRMIVAHEKAIDQQSMMLLLLMTNARGLRLSPNFNSLTFPRDMMAMMGGDTYINPKANLDLVYEKGIESPLGEGGRVLKSKNKILVPNSQDHLAADPRFARDVRVLQRKGFKIGSLPWPLSIIDATPGAEEVEISPSDHLDRAAALVRGKEGRDFLLLDEYYARSRTPLRGDYFPLIQETCDTLDITPVVVPRDEASIPCALNLEQFADGSVLMTGGDPVLEEIVEDIVGEGKVQTTEVPIIYYPVIRKGGIRCMTLVASDKIVKK